VPTLVRASALIPNLWHVRIANVSTEVMSAFHIDVFAVDKDNKPVPDGCHLADRTAVGEAMGEFFVPELSRMMSMMNDEFQKFVQQIKDGLVSIGAAEAELNANLDHLGTTINEHQAALLKEQVKHVIATQLTDQWPTVLSPGQFATMPFILSSVEYAPRLYMRFEDPAGYTWERTDITKPSRVMEPQSEPKPVETPEPPPKRKW
jgi:hypothetical protein